VWPQPIFETAVTFTAHGGNLVCPQRVHYQDGGGREPDPGACQAAFEAKKAKDALWGIKKQKR